MTETRLRYDNRAEVLMQNINSRSNAYTAEGVDHEAPAIGSVRVHPTAADNESIITERKVDSLASSYINSLNRNQEYHDVRYEVNVIGKYTAEIVLFEA
jgi:hypothetical protein